MSNEQTILKIASTRLRESQAIRYYHDLLALVVLGFLLPILLVLPIPLLRVPLGFVGTFLAPGYAMVLALFPRRCDLDRIARAALTIGLSVTALPILALLLNMLPWGIRPWTMVLALTIWITFWSFLAAFRRKTLGLLDEGGSLPPIDLPAWWRHIRERTLSRRANTIGMVALAGLFVFGSVVLLLPDPTQRLTEFYILGPEGLAENYPRQASPGQEIQVGFGIVNREGTAAQYRIEVYSQARKLAQYGPTTVQDRASWFGTLHFALSQEGDNQLVQILLFRDDNYSPYRQLQLWINVRENP